jgi:hypothetical protein
VVSDKKINSKGYYFKKKDDDDDFLETNLSLKELLSSAQ